MADEQVGNNSYTTMTPGSAVAGQLQNILTQKRLEARQAMLDSLHAKDVQSEMDYRAENAKSLAADRASKEEDRKAQQLTRMTSVLSPHMAISPQSENYQTLKDNNLIDPGQAATAPLGPDDQGPSMPAIPETFHGLPKQLEEEKQQGLQAELQKLMSDPAKWDPLPDAQKEALYRAAYKASIPENVLRPKVGGKIITFNEADGKYTYADGTPATTKGPNDVIERRGRAPIGPAAHPSRDFAGTEAGPDGVEQNVIYTVGDDNIPKKLPFGSGFHIAGRAGVARTPPAQKPANTKDKTWGEFVNAKAGVMTSPSNKNAQDMYTTLAKKVIGESTHDPVVNSFLADAWDTPGARKVDADTLIKSHKSLDPTIKPLTESQMNEIRATWNLIKDNQ